MQTRTLIPASSLGSFGRVDSLHFQAHRSANGLTGPRFYSIKARVNGLVTITEYSSEEEYREALSKARALVGNRHKALGMIKGCACLTCN